MELLKEIGRRVAVPLTMLFFSALATVGFLIGTDNFFWMFGIDTSPKAEAQQIVAVTTPQCRNPKYTSTTLTSGAAVACPSTQLASRRFIVICNPSENPSTGLIKVRIDGTAPVMGAGSPGDVVTNANCVAYAIDATVTPQCNTGTGSMFAATLECQ